MNEFSDEQDQIIDVRLPRKDYLILREIIDDRSAVRGLRRWLQDKVFWLAGGVLTILGCYETFRRWGG